ncbi:hypothetical protein BC834DRAFT_892701 [Gloeopeniophorella convolvens]|nr:hypothetical protein BC834DRAFT_892701 [Gloeopeniophorella convolvens]
MPSNLVDVSRMFVALQRALFSIVLSILISRYPREYHWPQSTSFWVDKRQFVGTPMLSTVSELTLASDYSSLPDIFIMSLAASDRHIGLAAFAVPNLPPQWSIVLSPNVIFRRDVWCGSLSETVNGRGIRWENCGGSLTAANTMGLLQGIIRVGRTALPLNHIQTLISKTSSSSEVAQYRVHPSDGAIVGTEKFIISALLALKDVNGIVISHSDASILVQAVRSRLTQLQQMSRTTANGNYPIVDLENSKTSYDHAMYL